MKITCCWMYVIGKYGFCPKLELVYKAIEEMSDLGFKFIELEGVGEENLTEAANNKGGLLKACKNSGVKVADFAIMLRDVFSMDASVKNDALRLFKKGVETADYLNSDFIWIDSYMPPVEIKSGKTFSQSMKFGLQIKVKIPSEFVWNDVWDNFVDSIKKCNQMAKKYGIPLLIEPRLEEIISNTAAMVRKE